MLQVPRKNTIGIVLNLYIHIVKAGIFTILSLPIHVRGKGCVTSVWNSVCPRPDLNLLPQICSLTRSSAVQLLTLSGTWPLPEPSVHLARPPDRHRAAGFSLHPHRGSPARADRATSRLTATAPHPLGALPCRQPLFTGQRLFCKGKGTLALPSGKAPMALHCSRVQLNIAARLARP